MNYFSFGQWSKTDLILLWSGFQELRPGGLLPTWRSFGLDRSRRLLDEQSRDLLQKTVEQKVQWRPLLITTEYVTDWFIDWLLTDLLQFQQQSLELVHYSKDSQSLFSLLWKTQAWFTLLDLSNSPPHGLDPLLNSLDTYSKKGV